MPYWKKVGAHCQGSAYSTFREHVTASPTIIHEWRFFSFHRWVCINIRHRKMGEFSHTTTYSCHFSDHFPSDACELSKQTPDPTKTVARNSWSRVFPSAQIFRQFSCSVRAKKAYSWRYSNDLPLAPSGVWVLCVFDGSRRVSISSERGNSRHSLSIRVGGSMNVMDFRCNQGSGNKSWLPAKELGAWVINCVSVCMTLCVRVLRFRNNTEKKDEIMYPLHLL